MGGKAIICEDWRERRFVWAGPASVDAVDILDEGALVMSQVFMAEANFPAVVAAQRATINIGEWTPPGEEPVASAEVAPTAGLDVAP